ncbi:molecular chaperone SurA [Mangrovimicrobium sediminis]|uniref:Chaperone SurA n=1 Tax=Mangrovimicrobium sediminis TaxID=2562682 RepID=A0A4Z0LYP6_9GAMM|nr:peptidylprolyl isomerase [Haliea sp. SAOS-164]TGD72472.1 molecular chaperone SurA [Haliea sp. SAOS-164]
MNIKTLLASACLAGALLAGATAQAETEMLDQVVAIVEDDVIMASELRDRIAMVKGNLASAGVDAPPDDEIIRETLDRLILESIQLQMGQRVGVRITDAQLNQALQGIAAQNGLTLDQFRSAVEQQGRSYQEARENIRREMIIQRVQQGNVNQRIQISEQEVDNFLATDDGKKLVQEEYLILHALLAVSPDASEEEIEAARAYAEKVRASISAGTGFEQAVGAPGPYSFSGGSLGWRKLDDLPSLFADIAPSLAVGETSDVLRSDSGFHLINLADKRGGSNLMVDQTRVRHILVKPSEILSDAQARERVTELRQRIEAGEDFGALARQYSEDIGSAQEGGDLGWTMPGQMVPEFEAAMNATAVGEISDPVRSQFGWHILQVEDRREQDMSDQARRNMATNFLHQRKYQEELDAWLRQIRDEAFVDIK